MPISFPHVTTTSRPRCSIRELVVAVVAAVVVTGLREPVVWVRLQGMCSRCIFCSRRAASALAPKDSDRLGLHCGPANIELRMLFILCSRAGLSLLDCSCAGCCLLMTAPSGRINLTRRFFAAIRALCQVQIQIQRVR